MPEQVNGYEAKTNLSKLLERVEAGEEIVIARNSRPVAQLVPLQRNRPARVPGSLRGRIRLAPDFEEPDDELIDLMLTAPIVPEQPHRG